MGNDSHVTQPPGAARLLLPPEAEAADAAAIGTEENEPAALAQEWSPDSRGSIGVTAPDTK